MSQDFRANESAAWREAEKRAESYLRLWRGELQAPERALVAQSLQTARVNARITSVHPVTLVMAALFDLLPNEQRNAISAMTPPLQRRTMLPEKTEFPFHEGLRRLKRTHLLPFAGIN